MTSEISSKSHVGINSSISSEGIKRTNINKETDFNKSDPVETNRDKLGVMETKKEEKLMDRLYPEGVKEKGEDEKVQSSGKEQKLNESIGLINQYVQSVRRELNFAKEEETGKTVITVWDMETEELIRQIPSEEVLNTAKVIKSLEEEGEHTDRVISGLILAVKA